jgi:hypothetical protein
MSTSTPRKQAIYLPGSSSGLSRMNACTCLAWPPAMAINSDENAFPIPIGNYSYTHSRAEEKQQPLRRRTRDWTGLDCCASDAT